MSHFAVLVHTKTKPTQDDLNKILAPYHENDMCDGGKWDWFVLGGRFTGMFATNYDPSKDPANIETCDICGGGGRRTDIIGTKARAKDPSYTCNGCNGTGKRSKWPTEWVQAGNQICGADLQILLPKLREEAATKAGETYDKYHKALAGRVAPQFAELEQEYGREKARDIYWNHPVVKAVSEAGFFFLNETSEAALNGTREAYCAHAADHVLTTFAFVTGGKWYERGQMGWWAVVTKAKDPELWDREFNKFLETLKPNEWLTVVDCHI